MSQTSPNETTPTNSHLMQVLDFDEADLAANREGRISDAQKARQRARIVQLAVLIVLVACALLIFAAMSIGIVITSSRYSSDSGSLMMVAIITLVFVLAMGLIPVFSMIPQWRRNRQALANGVVSSIEGVTDLRDIRSKRYALMVKDDQGRELGFNVRRVVRRAFGKGMRYRVYFIPMINYVVAAEELDH